MRLKIFLLGWVHPTFGTVEGVILVEGRSKCDYDVEVGCYFEEDAHQKEFQQEQKHQLYSDFSFSLA